MAGELERLTASVAAIVDVDSSIIALCANLSGMLRASAGNAAAIRALADTLDAKAQEVADAVTANTPEPTP